MSILSSQNLKKSGKSLRETVIPSVALKGKKGNLTYVKVKLSLNMF